MLKNIFVIKNLLIILLAIICVILFVNRGDGGINYEKEKKKLKSQIEILEKKSDSLNSVAVKLQEQYVILSQKSYQDSLVSDNLRNEYDKANNVIKQSNDKVAFYLGKLHNTENKINFLENNKNYKTGDNLLLSLTKKIN